MVGEGSLRTNKARDHLAGFSLRTFLLKLPDAFEKHSHLRHRDGGLGGSCPATGPYDWKHDG